MNADKISAWERLAGLTSGIAVLAWLGTLSMWGVQIFTWLLGGQVSHPSILGTVRATARWFGIASHTWADRPYAGLSLYGLLRHAYVTSTCLIVAVLFSAVSVMIIVRDDRERAVPPFDDAVPRSEASSSESGNHA